MIKAMHFCTRKKGTTHEECIRHHREVHAPLAKSILGPKIKRYVGHYVKQAIAQPTIAGGGADLPFDFVAEIWLDDEVWNSMAEFHKSPDGLRIVKDEEKFIDRAKMWAVTFEDNVIVEFAGATSEPLVKTLFLDKKREGMTHEECIRHHREIHGPLVKKTFGPRIRRYVGHYVEEELSRPTIDREKTQPAYDFFPEVWFDQETWAKLKELHGSPEFRELDREEEEFIDPKQMVAVIFEDNFIV